jgi:excisionase family DNA binding protein
MRKRKVQIDVPSTVPATPPQLLSIPEVARILSIGRTKVYDLIKRDGLPTVKIGSSHRVSATSLKTWIEQREQAAS